MPVNALIVRGLLNLYQFYGDELEVLAAAGEHAQGRERAPAGPRRQRQVPERDNGAGLGASHQTGWTGVIARLLDLFGRLQSGDALSMPKEKLEARLVREQVHGK